MVRAAMGKCLLVAQPSPSDGAHGVVDRPRRPARKVASRYETLQLSASHSAATPRSCLGVLGNTLRKGAWLTNSYYGHRIRAPYRVVNAHSGATLHPKSPI